MAVAFPISPLARCPARDGTSSSSGIQKLNFSPNCKFLGLKVPPKPARSKAINAVGYPQNWLRAAEQTDGPGSRLVVTRNYAPGQHMEPNTGAGCRRTTPSCGKGEVFSL